MNWVSKILSIQAVADKVVDQGLSLVIGYWNVEEDLGRLRRTSGHIYYLLTDAEERRCIEDESVINWLNRLKSVYFDTHDLLDEYQTAVKVHKHSTNVAASRKRKWYQKFPSIGPEWNLFQRRRFTSQIDAINSSLAEITENRKNLRLKGEDGKRRGSSHPSARPFQTGPSHDRARIIGRDDDKNEIVNLLIPAQTSASASAQKFTVVPIHGAPGIGKTTLAQMVCDDPRLDCFDIKAWVCLTERCDVRTAMKKIYEKMTGQMCDLRDLDTLQHSLRDYLKTRENKNNNKFLLVIDNFWATDWDYWEMLRVPLLAGGDGSKVLITTCNERTYKIMPGVIQRPSLKGLDEEDCWQLIQSLVGVINQDHEKLVPIGKQIARRCHGSPMAAKALGAVLNGRSQEEWSDVLSEMRALKDDINGVVLASLKISYHHLKYHLKRCFAYCSIFPNGYVFERDQLIRYWIAEGLIEPDGRRRLEAVGTKYFEELVWRSFFEKITIGTKGQNAKHFSRQIERYRMPSLMLDLAMEVSKYEFRSFESGKPLLEGNDDNSDQARYASVLQPKNTNTVKLECLEPYSNLRTLKFCHELNEGVVVLNSIQEPFFRKFMHLRILDMSNSDLNLVPDSVGELIHLRFLGLSNTKITTLPEKICDLFNLQTLELKGCLELAVLPEGLRRLINLRHLDLHLDWEVITDSTEVSLPQGIGDLEDLQTLTRFNVTSSDKGQFCNISELKNLNLRGDLCMLNLEKVSSGHAEKANLQGKQFIENLMLRWHSSALNDEQLQQQSEEVINFLQPHNWLRCLWIVNYPGTRFPDWMGDTSFSSLETIRISNCNNVSFLPLLGQLPRLKNLLIDNITVDMITMPGGFPSLEHLQLLNLSSLQSLYVENEIPKLKQIDVSDCPNLLELVVHRHLHDKIERENFPNLRITCVPLESN
ncbi:disease resistance protein RGA1 [Carex littledalei]|uniref:Disease resistance protein RGA1 n=1 Tax=Carex littledalei TaxID=544730 RepID=A0A833V3Q6_9POAL|nr:disease resistance protein RGA1 [Carex littledalei]